VETNTREAKNSTARAHSVPHFPRWQLAMDQIYPVGRPLDYAYRMVPTRGPDDQYQCFQSGFDPTQAAQAQVSTTGDRQASPTARFVRST
jgi:hypothetical protein